MDNSGTSTQAGQGRIAALAALIALTLLAGVAVVARGTDPATARTVLTGTRAAVLVERGVSRPAVDGQVVPRGATLRTGPGGAARLDTAGRSVYVGALSTLTVTDGLRQVLDRGQVMVDSRSGPRLVLTTPAGPVQARRGSLSRVELGPVLRLAVFDGAASVTPAGRQATTVVSALAQVQMPYDGVAGRTTPLALSDDAWESRLASDLVTPDLDLQRLAASLSGSAGAVVLAAVRTTAEAGTVRGEQALTATLAQAARRGGAPAQRLDGVRAARSAGGSWGVVAALYAARVTAVSALLDQLLAPAPAPATVAGGPVTGPLAGLLGATGILPPQAPGGAAGGAAGTAGGAVGGSPGTRVGSAGAPASSPPGGRPTASVRPPNGVTPQPPPSPPPTLVDQVVGTVLGLLPVTPAPVPAAPVGAAAPSRPVAPSRLPSPVVPVVPLPTPSPLPGLDHGR